MVSSPDGTPRAGAPSAGARFEVSLVPHDVREEESLHAALDALVRLSDVANRTFSRITDRSAVPRRRWRALLARAAGLGCCGRHCNCKAVWRPARVRAGCCPVARKLREHALTCLPAPRHHWTPPAHSTRSQGARPERARWGGAPPRGRRPAQDRCTPGQPAGNACFFAGQVSGGGESWQARGTVRCRCSVRCRC
jgi:hypothetical protein